MVSKLTFRPRWPRFDSQEEKNVNIAEVNQQRCLKESGQLLENVGGTHLILARGKLVLQKALLWKLEMVPQGCTRWYEACFATKIKLKVCYIYTDQLLSNLLHPKLTIDLSWQTIKCHASS